MTGRWTIAEAERLLPQAKRVAKTLGISEDKAPLHLGLISTDLIPAEIRTKLYDVAKALGWIEGEGHE